MAKTAKRGAKTQDVAEEFSVNARTVHEWVSMGCPCTRSTRGNKFDMGEVAKWKRANKITGEPGRPSSTDSGDLEAAKLRKENALAAKYEIQVERERGTLVSIADVKTRWAQKVTTAKSKFLGLPASVAPRLEGLNTATIQGELERAVTDILNDLASG